MAMSSKSCPNAKKKMGRLDNQKVKTLELRLESVVSDLFRSNCFNNNHSIAAYLLLTQIVTYFCQASQEMLGVKFERYLPSEMVRSRNVAPRRATSLLSQHSRNFRIAGGVLAD